MGQLLKNFILKSLCNCFLNQTKQDTSCIYSNKQTNLHRATTYFIILFHRYSQIDYVAISIVLVAIYIVHSFFGESGSFYAEYQKSSLIETRVQTFRVCQISMIVGSSTTLHLALCFICSMEGLVFLGSIKLWFGFLRVLEVWVRFLNDAF